MIASAFVESNARFSPDGRWIAYQSNESGTQGDVYIQSFPAPGVKQQVSTKGGILPRWGPNSTDLFYVTPTSTLMSVSLKSAGAVLQVGIPVPLFSLPAFQAGGDYDVSADGRFLVRVEQAGIDELRAELRAGSRRRDGTLIGATLLLGGLVWLAVGASLLPGLVLAGAGGLAILLARRGG